MEDLGAGEGSCVALDDVGQADVVHRFETNVGSGPGLVPETCKSEFSGCCSGRRTSYIPGDHPQT